MVLGVGVVSIPHKFNENIRFKWHLMKQSNGFQPCQPQYCGQLHNCVCVFYTIHFDVHTANDVKSVRCANKRIFLLKVHLTLTQNSQWRTKRNYVMKRERPQDRETRKTNNRKNPSACKLNGC